MSARFDRISYVVRLVTDEPEARVDLLAGTLAKHGTEPCSSSGCHGPYRPYRQRQNRGAATSCLNLCNGAVQSIDPTWFAAAAYMLMFGDVGHGLAVILTPHTGDQTLYAEVTFDPGCMRLRGSQ